MDGLRVQDERQDEGQLVVQVDVVDGSSKVIAHPPVARKPVVGLHLRNKDSLDGSPPSCSQACGSLAVGLNPVVVTGDGTRVGVRTVLALRRCLFKAPTLRVDEKPFGPSLSGDDTEKFNSPRSCAFVESLELQGVSCAGA